MIRVNKYILVILITTCPLTSLVTTAEALKDEIVQIGQFSKMDLDGWENKLFAGETKYSIKSIDKNSFLHAESIQSASALYKKIKVNINDTPYLNWSWRIDKPLTNLHEKDKSGDDYAARIYVVFKTGYTPLSAKALNYIWSSNNITGTHWPNAYTEKAIMIPLRSKQDKLGTWQVEKVNIRDDLLKHFEKLPAFIDGVALMTDTDNSKGVASASYGDIYFSSN